MSSEKETAYHEAGHAVAFWLFGQRIQRVSIDPTLKAHAGGFVEPMPGSKVVSLQARTLRGLESYTDLPEVVMQVVVYQAGAVAQTRAGYAAIPSGIDANVSSRLALSVCHDQAEAAAFVAWCAQRARTLLAPEPVWSATTMLAEALTACNTIDGRLAEDLIERGIGRERIDQCADDVRAEHQRHRDRRLRREGLLFP